jgi:hypothetical protein
LVSWSVQITTAIIAAEVVTKRGNGSTIIEDVFAHVAGVQDAICYVQWRGIVTDCTTVSTRVTANCAVGNL